jgi:ADP-glucose pyrophosphorylase
VDKKDATRFGIMEVDGDNWITVFEEKPFFSLALILLLWVINVFRMEFLAEKIDK